MATNVPEVRLIGKGKGKNAKAMMSMLENTVPSLIPASMIENLSVTLNNGEIYRIYLDKAVLEPGIRSEHIHSELTKLGISNVNDVTVVEVMINLENAYDVIQRHTKDLINYLF